MQFQNATGGFIRNAERVDKNLAPKNIVRIETPLLFFEIMCYQALSELLETPGEPEWFLIKIGRIQKRRTVGALKRIKQAQIGGAMQRLSRNCPRRPM